MPTTTEAGMTRRIPPNNQGRRALCYALGIHFIVSSAAYAFEQKGIPMNKAPATMTIWQTIAQLTQQISFSEEKVEEILATKLNRSAEQGNEYFWFYESGGIALQSGTILKVDLRIQREGNHPGFLVLNVSGDCITLPDVRLHYEKLQLTDSPRGRSLDEVTSYTATLPWGGLSFSFKERRPECLSSVAFQPKKA